MPGRRHPGHPAGGGLVPGRERRSVIGTYLTRGEAETAALAASLSRSFRGGEVVLLTGDLGAGKTAFVRGLVRGLGGSPEDVSSPTFVLLTSYAARLPVHHADLYRLRGDGDEEEIGLRELPGPGAVLAVEWAERLRDPSWAHVFRVSLEHAGDDRRRVTVEETAFLDDVPKGASS